MTEYFELERVLDDKNIITVQTKEYGSIDVIPVDTITDIELSDVQPVKHGKWLHINNGIIFCSECEHEAYWDTDYGQQLFDYCPYCGARMDGDKE